MVRGLTKLVSTRTRQGCPVHGVPWILADFPGFRMNFEPFRAILAGFAVDSWFPAPCWPCNHLFSLGTDA